LVPRGAAIALLLAIGGCLPGGDSIQIRRRVWGSCDGRAASGWKRTVGSSRWTRAL